MKSQKFLAGGAVLALSLGGLVTAVTTPAEAATYCTHGYTKIDVTLRPDEGQAWASWSSLPSTQKFRAKLIGKGVLPDITSVWKTTSGTVKTGTMPWTGVGGSACENARR